MTKQTNASNTNIIIPIISAREIDDSFFEPKLLEEIDIVRSMLADIREHGDDAVRKYAEQFDKLGEKKFEVTRDEIRESYSKISPTVIEALHKAKENIQMFAELQMQMFEDKTVTTSFGLLGHKIIPLGRVGCYIPGGTYSLPSTALMTIIPAKVAGVREVLAFSPNASPEVLVAADMAGVDRIFRIGGVQAIGAMAYGTQSIPKVDKIVGPGNKYVTYAKKEVFGLVGIDFLAGPSEVMVIADDTGNPEIIAADLLAQAEHDVDAQSFLVTTSERLAHAVQKQVAIQLETLETKTIATTSISKGFIITVDSLEEAVHIANRKAPEHLELQVRDPSLIMNQLLNYGSLFIGEASAEVFGDYCAGPNHTLPTNGSARFTGGLSVKDFLKVVTFQELKDPSDLIPTTSTLAAVEKLDAHRKAALLRKNL